MAFLVIHVGAGHHSFNSRDEYKRLIRSALRTGSLLESSGIIEQSHLTNTGYGSALDRYGNASCDCTIALSTEAGTDVLSLLGIDDKTSPTTECIHIKNKLDEEFNDLKSLGLLKPASLQYYHVKKSHGTDESSELALPAAKRLYLKYKDFPEPPQQPVQDTVGVINFDNELTLSTSSGGTFLKFPGRVSCAGIYGSGLAIAETEGTRITCLCSGNGDDIIRMRLAGHIADILLRSAKDDDWPDFPAIMVSNTINQSKTVTLSARDNNHNPIVYVGVIAVIQHEGRTTLAYCHSTESFYFGFVNSNGEKEVVLSSQSDEAKIGHFVSGQYKL